MASRDIQYLKGIGEVRAELFRKLGISTVYALLRYYPRDYRDYSKITEIYNAVPQSVLAVKAKVITDVDEQHIRKNMVLYKFAAADDTGLITVTLFNNKYQAASIKKGKTYIFYGKITGNGGNRAMSSPEIVAEDKAGITPIYPTTAGLYQSNIRNAQKNALAFVPEDPIPDYIKSKYRLCDLEFALRNIHFPQNSQSLEVARRRLVFEELLVFRTGIAALKTKNIKASGTKLEKTYLSEFQELLPFTLTDAQLKAINECVTDMMSGRQMNRLVEGDVGSGKTAIATALMHSAALSKMQSAMMAPTEILAEQHFATVSNLLKDTGINVRLLIGSTKKREKDLIKAELKSGEADIVIGTQALIQGDVEFSNLSLVITDEQHRFGVAQRATLAAKGKNPHILVMSATPIPRTLALILYGDLDLSVVGALPRGRQPIETYSVNSSLRPRVYGYIKKHIENGNQGYIVCPLVEEGEGSGVAATTYYEELKNGEFKGYSLGLLHGKQKADEKETIMRAFSEGKIQLLVATTVVEVGVDVPNATIMVIENAERFGLSQLHQLRGRVGRGKDKSSCILITDIKDPKQNERLNIMCKTTDGFKIADADLKLRGPGDFMGNRQHGLPQFRIADLTSDMRVLEEAGNAANEMLSRDPTLQKFEHKGMRKEIGELWKRVNTLN